MPMPGTMLMKNSQCQDMASVMKPPTVGPMVGASVATRPMIGPTMWNFERGNTVKADANTVGIMPAPKNPWIARQRNPDSGIAITSAIRYDVWTHDTSLELADRPA